MAPLKLKNNTGLLAEKNLCYVNSALQILHNIPEFKEFFANKRYKNQREEKLPICDELSRLFNVAENFLSSASVLWRLVSQSSKKEYLMNGSQQDICEFLEILLEELEKEFSKKRTDANVLRKFRGIQSRLRPRRKLIP